MMNRLIPQALRNGGGAAPVAAAPAVDYLTPALAIVNGFSEGSFYNKRDATKIFSDAGTTPITSGGAIYRVNDLSSRANHLNQATLSHRPIFTGGQAVYSGGAGNGADANGKVMHSTPSTSSGRQKSLFASFTPNAAQDGWLLGQANAASALLGVWHTNGSFEYYCGASLTCAAGTFPAGVRSTIILNHDSQNLVWMYANGVLVTAAAGVSVGFSGGSAISIGNDGGYADGSGASSYFNGAVQGAGWIEGTFTGDATTTGQPGTAQILAMHNALINL